MDIPWCHVGGGLILFVLIKFFIPLLHILYRYTLSGRSLAHVKSLKTADAWAVVTGGTDGIGKAYVEELAAIGFNICIISRSLEKLQQVSQVVKEKHNVQTKIIQADFTKVDIYSSIRGEFKRMKVVVLVNNVGMTQDYPCQLWTYPADDSFYPSFTHCNMTSAVLTTRAALLEGGMLNRNYGLIITISSASGLYPLALGAMYCSSKVFLDFLSRSLRIELKDTKIRVQTVLPFYVLTKFIGRFRPPSLMAPSPEYFARSALRMVGVEDRTHGTLSHAIQGLISLMPPAWLQERVALNLNRKRAQIARGT